MLLTMKTTSKLVLYPPAVRPELKHLVGEKGLGRDHKREGASISDYLFLL